MALGLNASSYALANYTSSTTGSKTTASLNASTYALSNYTKSASPSSSSKPASTSASSNALANYTSLTSLPATNKTISAEAWNASATPSTPAPSKVTPSKATPSKAAPSTTAVNASTNALANYTRAAATASKPASSPSKSSPATSNASTNALSNYLKQDGRRGELANASTNALANYIESTTRRAGTAATKTESAPERLGAGWSRDDSGKLRYESDLISQLLVPGRGPADQLATDVANGDFGRAVIDAGAWILEDVLFVATLGSSQLKTAATKTTSVATKKLAGGVAASSTTESTRLVDNRLIGRVDPPRDVKFGTTAFGTAIHPSAAKVVIDDLAAKGVSRVVDRTGPGVRGVDLTIPDQFTGRLGFHSVEIKPDTASGLKSYNGAVARWGYDPSTVRAVTYDQFGNIRWGFTK